MMYSTNFFDLEPWREQASPITVLTERTHKIPLTDPRLSVSWWDVDVAERTVDLFLGRVTAAWWSHHPHIAFPDAEVTIFINGNFTTHVPDLAQRCLDELGDDDMLLLKHPWRDDIYAEAEASKASWKWTDHRQDMDGQVASYRAAGHPEHWGLFHGGMIVRRNNPRTIALYEAWWEEYRRWSSQDQLSLPHLLRTSDVRWHTWPDVGEWHAQPFEEGWIR